MELVNITLSEYNDFVGLKIPFSEEVRKFNLVDFGNNSVCIGWSSHLMDPKICNLDNLIFVGIDNCILFYCPELGETKVIHRLHSYFVDFVISSSYYTIISETEVTMFNISDLTVSKSIGMADVIESHSVVEDVLKLELMNGQNLKVDLN